MSAPSDLQRDALERGVLGRSGHLSELALERLAAGPGDEDPVYERLARGHLEACDPCQAALAALSGHDAALPPLARPSLEPARPVLSLDARRGRKAWPWAAVGVALAAAAAVALAVLPRAPSEGLGPDGPGGTGITLKGGALDFEVRDAAGRALEPNAVVHPGDRLSLYVRVAEPSFVAVWGRDAAGEAYAIHPPVDHMSALVAAPFAPSAAPERLADAIELDASGDRETLVAIACPTPERVEAVGLTDAGARARGCATRSLTLVKVPRP